MVSVSVIVVALILEAGILKYVNDANAYRLSKVLLDRVFTVLNKTILFHDMHRLFVD